MRVLVLLALALPSRVSASIGDQETLSPPAMAQERLATRPSLADLLTIESSASIFFSYARETAFSQAFSAVDSQLTLLVPTNKAVMALKRKPHLGVAEPEATVSEEQYDEQSRRNVAHWVGAHIIPSRISLSHLPATYDTWLDGKSVTLTPVAGGEDARDWSRVTLEGGVRIVDMKEGINGVIYMLDGTIKPS